MSFHRQKNARITGKHPDECDACEGLGQTRQCETVMVDEIIPGSPPRTRLVTARDANGRPKCGSGCMKCGGTGRLTQPSISDDDVEELRELLTPRATRVAHIPGRLHPGMLAAAVIAIATAPMEQLPPLGRLS